jgi:aspartyl protease family protein
MPSFYCNCRVPKKALLALVLSLAPAWCGAYEKISLHALFRDKAILIIDGARRVLKVGDESPEGVRLTAVDTREETARIEFEGRQRVLGLGVVATSSGSGGKGRVTLYVEPSGHFHADGFINDSPVRFLVDTGATNIAMSSAAAGRIGIDYKRLGKAGRAATASGVVRAYSLKLTKVQIGEITLHNVDAGVIEGNFPVEPLLGMSFLGELDMKRESDRMELRQR